jgi:predicted MFS family arabinose efflux permease
MTAARTPLRLRPFRRLAATYAVNGLGDRMGEIALAAAVYFQTQSALAVAALWLFQQGLGGMLAPVLVPQAERLPAGPALAGLYGVQAAVFLSLGLLAATDALTPALVLPLVALDGVVAPVARSLSRAAVVAVTRPAGLHREGNATLNVAFTLNCAAGPALGGVLVVAVGAETALLLDAASFVVCAAALGLGAGLPGAARTERGPKGGLAEAFAYVAHRPALRRMLTANALGSALLAAIVPIEIVFVTQTLHADEAAYGTVLTAWGAGMVLGGAIAPRLTKGSLGGMLVFGWLALGIAHVGMGLGTSVASVAAWSAVGGVGNGIEVMAFTTALQERTCDAFQARVGALYETATTAAPGLGFLAGGVVATLANPRAVYLVAGLGALAVLAWAVAGGRREWALSA